MPIRKKVIVIAGPTAAGKTSLAIEVAKHFNTQIISADSRQCYHELNIGVARPSETELAAVPHHFIASHSIHQKVSAGVFEKYALERANVIFEEKDTVVLVGGTGLYIDAFCYGIDSVPETLPHIRKEISSEYAEKGLEWLQAEVQQKDPIFYAAADIANPQRLMRALEVYRTTGKSITYYKTGKTISRPFDIIKIVLDVPKEQLHKNINLRVDVMMETGLLQEAKALYPHRNLTALQTVGYKEVFSLIEESISKQQCIELIKKHSRQYAKRQLTWFRKNPAYHWHNNRVEVLDFLKSIRL